MRSFYWNLFSLLLVLFKLMLYVDVSHANDCSKEPINAGVEHWIDSINDYQIDAEIMFRDVLGTAKISGKVPDFLHISLQINNSTELTTWTTIYDGTYQWIEFKKKEAMKVLKIKLEDLVESDRPFDTSYYIMGTGLLNGEDFVSTIQMLLWIYDLQVTCNDNNITMSGSIDKRNIEEYIRTRKFFRSQESVVEKYIEMFGFLSIEVDAASFAVKGYSMGNKEGEETLSVNFKAININPGLEKSLFFYTPPKGITPHDITDKLKDLEIYE